MLVPYISEEEYRCKHCHRLSPDFTLSSAGPFWNLFFNFRQVREAWGAPIPINSGYRCIEYNQQIGGEPNSIHTFGLALDLDCKDALDVDVLYKIIEEVNPNLRIGRYKKNATFIHIDVGYLIYPRASEAWRKGARWTG